MRWHATWMPRRLDTRRWACQRVLPGQANALQPVLLAGLDGTGQVRHLMPGPSANHITEVARRLTACGDGQACSSTRRRAVSMAARTQAFPVPGLCRCDEWHDEQVRPDATRTAAIENRSQQTVARVVVCTA